MLPLIGDHQRVAALAVGQRERAVNILQLLRQVELELEAADGIHVVHPQRDGNCRVSNAAGVLHV